MRLLLPVPRDGFTMNDRLAHSPAHDRRVADRAVRLSACFDRCHDGIGGDKPISSPLCRLRNRYVASATAKLPAMPTNPTETPESSKPPKIGLSDDFPREKLDRQVSVAPMMDWTDEAIFAL